MADFPTRIAYEEALAIVQATAAARRLPIERIASGRADGRVLAETLFAPMALPAFDNSAMDGFALRHADLAGAGATGLKRIGEQFAGPDRGLRLGQGECARITTGAVLPIGADTVAMKEIVDERGDRIHVLGVLTHGTHVRPAGQDVRQGEAVLRAGDALTPPRLALASALGMAQLPVSARPTVAVFTSGDELVEPGLPLAPGQIYNSNRALLMGLLRQRGLEPVAWPTLPDAPGPMASMLTDAAEAFDVIVTCGAVSAGEKDHLPALLAEHGETLFWKVRMKPGMPVLFGRLGRALLVGLPGNPVSVLATFMALVAPLLEGLQGAEEPSMRRYARLSTAWRKSHERLEFLRGTLLYGADAVLRVEPNPAEASHRLRAAADSNALIVLAEGVRDYAEGEVVEVIGY